MYSAAPPPPPNFLASPPQPPHWKEDGTAPDYCRADMVIVTSKRKVVVFEFPICNAALTIITNYAGAKSPCFHSSLIFINMTPILKKSQFL